MAVNGAFEPMGGAAARGGDGGRRNIALPVTAPLA